MTEIPDVLEIDDATPQKIHAEQDIIAATSRLAFARVMHPDLVRAEARARLELAAAIMAMDEAEDTPGRHSLVEQVAVEQAQRAYGQALADLVRGDMPAAPEY